MTRPVIGLSGRAGAGKDTLAAILYSRFGYVRHAFADPLRDMALAIDPSIVAPEYGEPYLSDVVRWEGWDEAKKRPDVRRFLQRLGTEGVRDHLGQDTWVRLTEQRIAASDAPDAPDAPAIVFTDVRYPNEVALVRRLGGLWVWIERPGANAAAGHVSEEALRAEDADVVIHNSVGVERLEELAPGLHASALRALDRGTIATSDEGESR